MKQVKLIATDMDHTLLTEQGELPPRFAEYIHELNHYGITFAIASGRPLYTLKKVFANLQDELTFISDNGGVISHHGERIYQSLTRTKQ